MVILKKIGTAENYYIYFISR